MIINRKKTKVFPMKNLILSQKKTKTYKIALYWWNKLWKISINSLKFSIMSFISFAFGISYRIVKEQRNFTLKDFWGYFKMALVVENFWGSSWRTHYFLHVSSFFESHLYWFVRFSKTLSRYRHFRKKFEIRKMENGKNGEKNCMGKSKWKKFLLWLWNPWIQTKIHKNFLIVFKNILFIQNNR